MNFIGVDGCKGGWFAVHLTLFDGWKTDISKDITNLWMTLQEEYDDDFIVFIDIPIGLKENGSEERLCDLQVRKLLGNRKRSVFPVPCRQAVYEHTWENACNVNLNVTGKSLSKQAFGITPKIREIDFFLDNENKINHIQEIHPELCFLGLAGYPMEHKKSIEEGFSERKEILNKYCECTNDIIDYALSNYKRKQVSKDDILDSLSAAVTAKLCYQYSPATIPERPEIDPKGLPMQMVYFKNNIQT